MTARSIAITLGRPMTASKPLRLEVYRTAIPMRGFEHAAASRNVAESIVTRLEFADGLVGYGQTLPRPYVTGETIDSVIADISKTIWGACKRIEFGSWNDPSFWDAMKSIPSVASDRCINAAACAVDIACMCRNLISVSRPTQPIAQRASGVLGSSDPAKTAKRLTLMQLFGMRDFKLKVGFADDIDAENMRIVLAHIGKGLPGRKYTLRVDVNGAWDASTTPDRIERLACMGICAVEQPVRCSAGELAELARKCKLPLIADESLLTIKNALSLLESPRQVWWNVRLSKNGGFARCRELLTLAASKGVTCVLGCMVGESSILSLWQRWLLATAGDPVRFVEGNYGKFLLKDDLTRKSLRFGYGGRLRVPSPDSPCSRVDGAKLGLYGRLVTILS